MTKERYIRMTEATRRAAGHLPGGARAFLLPTLLCALSYLAALAALALRRDARLLPALIVPAVCFGVVTLLRPLIGRQRPYDRFGAPPVGRCKPGKGKSMPSRHAASAAAIALAFVYALPHPLALAWAVLLCAAVAALRVLAGQHYPSDVFAALALSAAISAVGYGFFG